MLMDISLIKKQADNELVLIEKAEDLVLFEKKYLGKQGLIADVFKGLKDLPENERKIAGNQANLLKNELKAVFEQKSKQIYQKRGQTENLVGKIDVSRPVPQKEIGYLHLITQAQRELTDIFKTMGFEVVLGSEIESDWYNFDALNVPKDHPARDMQDTFWLKPESSKMLLRTHTSPMQARYMETHKPPFRIVVPGRVFRNEATDVKHEAQFYQLEGLMVDENISVSSFKAIMAEFLSQYFESKVEVRLRPGYFPFVEPGFEIDAKTKGGGPARRSPKGEGGWLELMGAGMVHPNVFKAAGLQQRTKGKVNFTGFAFGCGIERLAMIKHNILDLRLFYQNDLRFLKQF